jgi:hypothetical protein
LYTYYAHKLIKFIKNFAKKYAYTFDPTLFMYKISSSNY